MNKNEPLKRVASLNVYLWSQVRVRFRLASNGRLVSTMPFDHAALKLTDESGQRSQFFTVDPIQFAPAVFSGNIPLDYGRLRTVLGEPTTRFRCNASNRERLNPYQDAQAAITAWGTGQTAPFASDATLMVLWVAMKFYGSRVATIGDCYKSVRQVSFPRNDVQRSNLIRAIPGMNVTPYGNRIGLDGRTVTISRQVSATSGTRNTFRVSQTKATSVADAFSQGISLKGQRNGSAPRSY